MPPAPVPAHCTLQYGDAAFKKMLSSVVDTDCWESAREAAAAQGKTMAKQQAMAEGIIQSLQTALQRLQLELQQTQQQERTWQQQQEAQKVGQMMVALALSGQAASNALIFHGMAACCIVHVLCCMRRQTGQESKLASAI